MSAILLISRATLVALLCLGAPLAEAQPAQIAATTTSQSTPGAARSAPPSEGPPAQSAPAAASLSTLAATSSASPPATAVVEQPRPTGYFVGDLLLQRVLLQRDFRRYTPVSLPATGRVNGWFERRRVTLETDASVHRWLVIEYQLLNAPKAVTTAVLPAWQLMVKSDDTSAPVTLKIPAASVNVAPLSPPGSPEQVGTRDLRPDHVPPRIPTEPIRRALVFSGGGFGVTLAAWLAWVIWRNRRADTTQPFARALRELRTLPDGESRAWQILHRAIDHTAGRVIQSATLPVLFERAPQLIPARPQIERFYAHSSQKFFASANANPIAGAGDGRTPHATTPMPSGRTEVSATTPMPSGRTELSATTHPEPPDPAPLPLTLCLELRRIEKRHER